MTSPHNRIASKSRRLALATTLWLLVTSSVVAQIAPSKEVAPVDQKPRSTPPQAATTPSESVAPVDEVFELSPFIVDASNDRGYESGNTLSGTRLNTPSKYVGSAAFEVTKALMNDLSLTNMQDLIDYAPNSSSYNGGGINQDPNGNNGLFSANYNVRGLLVNSLTRDFVNSRAPDDAYNTEQFSFTRGPNSILFGIGNPGGIANSVSARARMIDKYEVSFRADSNDSTRATFDFNKVILPKHLAIRIAGLKEEKHTNRKPSDRKSERLYGSVTIKPFTNTTIRVNQETGTLDSLNVRPWAAADGVSAWIDAGQKDIPAKYEAGGATYATTASNPAGQPSTATNTADLNSLGYEIQQPSPNSLLIFNSATPMRYLTQMGFITTARPNSGGGNLVKTLVNSPIPYTSNVLGYGNSLVQEIDNRSFFLEQKIGRNFYLEAMYNRQDTENWNNYSAGNQDNIYLDKQRTVLTADNKVITNPNYNRYFVSNINIVSLLSNYRDETKRLMGSYSLDLRKKLPGIWGRLLGHHNFAALGEMVTSDFAQANAFLVNTSPEALKPFSPRLPAAALTTIQNTSNRMGQASYFTLGDESTYMMRNLLNVYPAIIFDGTPLPAVSTDLITPAFVASSSTRSIQEIKSKLFVSQNYFWDDKVVTTFGFREDDSRLWLLPSVNNAANRNFTIDARTRDVKGSVNSIDRSGSTYTQGVVITPIRWVGLFYNRSSSFIPPAAQVDIYGNALPNGQGLGQDYGIKLSLLDGKVNASISRYTTEYNNVPGTILRTGATSINIHRLAIITAMNNTAIGGPAGPTWDGSDPNWQPASTIVNNLNDVKSEGYEITVTANPTKNWRIMFNFSHQVTKTSNFGTLETKWYNEVALAYFAANPQYLTILTGAGLQNANETVKQRLEDIATTLSLAKTLDGRADARQSQYSSNLVTGYDFRDGRLKGASLGATYKWRQKPILGYAYVAGRTDLFDSSNVFYGEDTNMVGMFASYRFQIKKLKTNAKLQLNVDGITSDEDLHPYSATDRGDGTPKYYRQSVGPGRTYTVTATFDF